MLLDLHTHARAKFPVRPPYPEGIISYEPSALPEPDAYPGQLYSVGIHPWTLAEKDMPSEEEWLNLEKAALRPDVVAIGECGIDIPQGGTLAIQRMVFKRQAILAERVRKPLIIHCVKGQEHIIAMHKELKPTVNWAIHGFRGKATVAKMFTDAGIWLSLGPQFQSSTAIYISNDRILAETDASDISIKEVIIGLLGYFSAWTEWRDDKIVYCSLEDVVSANLHKFLQLPPSTEQPI